MTQAPERLSLPVLAALCDCTPADLIVTDVRVTADRRASGQSDVVDDLPVIGRPRRSRVHRNQGS